MPTIAFETAYTAEKRGIHRYTEALLGAFAQTKTPHHFQLLAWFFKEFGVKKSALYCPADPRFTLHAVRVPERLVDWLEWQKGIAVIQSMLGSPPPAIYHCPAPRLPKLKKIKTVTTIHDLYFERYPALATTTMRLLARDAALRSDRIVTESEMAREEIETFYRIPRERIAVIPLAVNHDTFSPKPTPELTDVRTRLQLPKRFVLTVGPAGPHRNFEGLLEAMALVRKNQPDLDVVFLARFDAMEAAFHRVYERLGRPTWAHGLTRVSEADLPRLYGAAELFCRVEHYDGYGLPFLESMACGTPVLGSRRGAIPEILGPDLDYADPDDASDTARQIERLTTDRDYRTRQTEHAKTRVKTFTWQKTAQATLQIYETLL